MGHDVFISYSSKDKKVADAACAVLERRGRRCWIAPRDVDPGVEYGESIIGGINGSRVFILIFSGHANESPQVRREVERAVSRGLAILPFRIEDVLPTRSLEYFLGAPHWLDALTPPLERHLERLAHAVDRLLAEPQATRPSALQPTASTSKRGPNRPIWIGLVLVLAALAAGTAYWLTRAPVADDPVDNVQAANLTEANIQLSQPVPKRAPEPPAPLVDTTSMDLGPEGRRDATYFLQSASIPVSSISLTPSSARLVFLYRSRFHPADALLGGSSPILALEHQGGGTSTLELRFMDPVAEVRLKHAGRRRTGPGFLGGAVLFPSVSISAYDRRGAQVGNQALSAWRSDAASAPMDGWIAFRAPGPDGIHLVRVVADGIIEYLLPTPPRALAAGEPPPPPPFRAAFALSGLEVRR